ncbi:MAG: hypothetical protein KC503_14980 [Myxococcales bacterium]|nr:hypothetical protein [Myxococcales bacterium]
MTRLALLSCAAMLAACAAVPPKPAMFNKPSSALCRGELTLGKAQLVESGTSYGVAGTVLRIEMLGAAMAHASDDNHFMTAKVKLRHGAHSKTLELREGRPQIWRGYLVGVSSAQYAWGKKTFTFGVERAHR